MPLKFVPYFVEENQRDDKHGAYDVFADDLEKGKPFPFDIAVREIARKHQRCNRRNSHEICSEQEVPADSAPDENGRHAKGDSLKEARRNPELGGEVGAITREYSHSFIGEGMEQIDDSDEGIADADELQAIVGQEPARVPGEDKESEADCDGRDFDEAVEQGITEEAAYVKRHDDCRDDADVGERFVSNPCEHPDLLCPLHARMSESDHGKLLGFHPESAVGGRVGAFTEPLVRPQCKKAYQGKTPESGVLPVPCEGR